VKRVSVLASVVCLAVLLGVCGPAAAAKPQPATTVYKNGYIWTVDKSNPCAQAVAVRGTKIVYVGGNAGVKAYVGKKTKVVNLKGKMMMPGLIDAHQHPLSGGESLAVYNLGNIQRTIPDLQALLQSWLDESVDQEPDGWLEVMGYRGALPTGTPLTRADLDALDTRRPVVIYNWDFHSLWVNTRGLEISGVDASTPTPPGGYIEKDAEGNPTGYFADAAMSLVTSHIPPTEPEDPSITAQRAVDALNAVGITGVMDAGGSADSLELWKQKYEEGELTLRFASTARIDAALAASDPDAVVADMNRVRETYSVPNRIMVVQGKIILDGVPDYPAQNAWMLEPYLEQDESGNWVPGVNFGNGAPFWDPELLKSTVVKLNLEGWPVHIHALGDASVRWSLDCYEAGQDAGASKDLRNTICHLEPVKRSDVWRFGELHVVPCVQPQWHEWGPSTFGVAPFPLPPTA